MQPQPEEEEVAAPVRAPREDGEEDEEEEEAVPEPVADDDDDDNKNKKPVAQPPVAPVLIGRPEPSKRDTMIELHTKALLQTSSTILAVSCFNNK